MTVQKKDSSYVLPYYVYCMDKRFGQIIPQKKDNNFYLFIYLFIYIVELLIIISHRIFLHVSIHKGSSSEIYIL
jgi:hypothetical protein